MSQSATIVITTYNRRDELRNAISSALGQTGAHEILIMDDGSTDGTLEMVTSDFPTVRFIRSETNIGLIGQRSKAARIASGDVIFSIDDDAEFSDPEIVQSTLKEFVDPKVGAVGIPLVNVKQSPDILQRSPVSCRYYVLPQYIGTAHAVRRDLFLALGGYCDIFYRQLEESDFCLRMLNAGFYVKAGDSRPILHHESPKRVKPMILFYQNRNNILFAWRNVPWPMLPIHLLATAWNGLRYGARLGFLTSSINGLLDSLNLILRGRVHRRPVSTRSYLLFRKLRRTGGMFLDSIGATPGHGRA